MREVLFRGKSVDNGKWVYGNFVMDATELRQRERQAADPILADGFIRRYDFQNHKVEMFEVERETVGQYIGLTDKNGQKIFEGDKVNVYLNASADDEPEDTGVIVFQDGSFGVKFNRRFSMVRNQFLPCYSIIEYYKGFFEVIQ